MKKVLITGFGSVGHALASILPSDLYLTTGIKRSESTLKLSNLTILRADLCDTNSLSSIKEEAFDYLIYCPSPDKRDKKNYDQTYVKPLENLLQLDKLLSSLQQFIFISSTSVYGQKKGEWVDEESETSPEHFSGKILLEAESLLLTQFKKKSTILRFGGIYGKQKSRYIQKIKKGSIHFDHISPKYTNRIHIQDCASSIKHIMALKEPQNIYLGVDDHPTDQKEVISWLTQKLGLSPASSTSHAAKHQKSLTNTSNKRCKNHRLKKSGYTFLYPSYKEGYLSMLDTHK